MAEDGMFAVRVYRCGPEEIPLVVRRPEASEPRDCGDTTGLELPWSGAVALAKFLQAHPKEVAGRDVVELAAGSGLCGLVAARLGAASVTLTDGEATVVSLLRDHHVGNEKGVITASTLAYGDALDVGNTLLVADGLYLSKQVEPLLETLEAFVYERQGKILFAHEPRRTWRRGGERGEPVQDPDDEVLELFKRRLLERKRLRLRRVVVVVVNDDQDDDQDDDGARIQAVSGAAETRGGAEASSCEIYRVEATDEAVIALAKAGDVEGFSKVDVDVVAAAKDRHGSGCCAWAAGEGHLDALRWLVQVGKLDPSVPAWPPLGFSERKEAPTTAGRVPLHFAARHGRLAVARYLAAECCKDADPRSKTGVTPLQLAVWQNHFDVARYLVEERGVDPAQRNDVGCALSHWLAMAPTTEDATPLGEWLAGLLGVAFFRDARNDVGHAPLHKAAFAGNRRTCEWLVAFAGAFDDDLLDDRGSRPSDEALRNGHADLAAWLRRHDRKTKVARTFLGLLRTSEEIGNATHRPPSEEEEERAVRKAFHAKARASHPDRVKGREHLFHEAARSRDVLLLNAEEQNDRHHDDDHIARAVRDACSHSSSFTSSSSSSGEENKISPDLATLRVRVVATVLENSDTRRGLALTHLPKAFKRRYPGHDLPSSDDRRALGLPRGGGILRMFAHPTFRPVLRVDEAPDGTRWVVALPDLFPPGDRLLA